ncbi:MAG: S8 family peptidase [Bdellovibrio sp.]|nr:S8 family peptidase [Bdellovibrio sp.]
MRNKNIYSFFVVFFVLTAANAFAAAPSRWIVAYKSKQTSIVLKGVEHNAAGRVFTVERKPNTEVLTSVLAVAKKMSEAGVAYIEKDNLMQVVAETFGSPNDPLFQSQWHYSDSVSGISLPDAWSLTQGQNPINVAVVDTGILPHPDLLSKTLPGMDMVSDSTMGADGDGRDSDATDPGDWIAPGDFCYVGRASNSSWHGTHVAGTVGALTNNGVGVAGVNPGSRIIPVRVLGKCGGYTSDIIDGIRWAAGISVAGLASNPNPAKVINLSLGAPGTCTRSMQEAINDVRAKGILLVVASGNSGVNIDYQNFTPANCNGVVTVGASNAQGGKAYYSNYGTRIDVMAPGGDSWQGILSTSDFGSTTSTGATYKSMSGTSMAAPHVTGVISLMYALNSSLVPSQVIDILKETAESMPLSFGCEGGVCGAGLINAFEAISLARITSTAGVKDDFTPTLPNDSGAQTYQVSNSDDGGGCGHIDLSGGASGGSGGPFIMSLILGMVMVFIAQKLGQNKKASK